MTQPPEASVSARRLLDARGPELAFAAALVAGLPALSLPFLSDDWSNLAAVENGVPARTAFGYLRPFYLALFRAERSAWGLDPWPYHAANILLFAVCAGLAVVALRRLTEDGVLAGAAGIVFALNPFAIEPLAWIAGRADLLACAFSLAGLLAWDRWRASGRPGPIVAAFLLYGAGLASKESAAVLPAVLAIVEISAPRPERSRRAAVLSLLAMGALGAVHLFVLRPQLLGIVGDAIPRVSPRAALGNAVGYLTASVLPLPAEFLEMHRRAAGAVALGVIAVLVVAARRGSRALPLPAVVGAAAAAVAAVPAIFAFQERNFLLPSAGVALALVAVVRAGGIAARRITLSLAIAVGSTCAVLQWAEWLEAGRASESVVSGLVRAASDPEVSEIVIANSPHRVRGAPVAADFSALVALHVGRRLPVLLATRVDYPAQIDDALDASTGRSVVHDGDDVVVRLRIVPGLYSRLVPPLVASSGSEPLPRGGSVAREERESVVVRIPALPGSGRVVLVWLGGALVPAVSRPR